MSAWPDKLRAAQAEIACSAAALKRRTARNLASRMMMCTCNFAQVDLSDVTS
jgi:hypothetical protein